MTEIGTVIESKKDFIQVRIGRNSACGACGKCGMTEKQKHVDFFVQNTKNAKVGDIVTVEIPEANSAKLALVAYILPIIPALLLMFLGFWLKWPDWAALILFFGGLALGFVLVVIVDKIHKHKWAQSPTLVSVLAQKTSDEMDKNNIENN
jgi:sigma-E factor negative regulatory protein RseC